MRSTIGSTPHRCNNDRHSNCVQSVAIIHNYCRPKRTPSIHVLTGYGLCFTFLSSTFLLFSWRISLIRLRLVKRVVSLAQLLLLHPILWVLQRYLRSTLMIILKRSTGQSHSIPSFSLQNWAGFSQCHLHSRYSSQSVLCEQSSTFWSWFGSVAGTRFHQELARIASSTANLEESA